MIDIYNTCRTCMKTKKALVNLFKPCKNNNGNYSCLAEALTDCTIVQVLQDDGLPQGLCHKCVEKLEIAYSFRLLAAKSELELKKLIEADQAVKNEPTCLEPQEFNFLADVLIEPGLLKGEDDGCTDASEFMDIKEEEQNEKTYVCCKCNKQINSENGSFKQSLTNDEHKFTCKECEDSYSLTAFEKQDSIGTIDDPEIKDEDLTLECEKVLSDLENETDIVNNDSRYKCKQCKIKFKTRRSLASHSKKHKNEVVKHFECDVCHAVFKLKNLLRRHMNLHKTKKPYECCECNKQYSRLDQCKMHMKTVHGGVKQNVCPYCNKAFAQLCNLKDHIRVHTGETPFLCSECGKGFNNNSNLRQHLLRHSGVKPFTCSLCPKTFCTKGQARVHMDTHTGVHPYKCLICSASFTRPQSLKKHSLIHLGIKPFQCDVCGMKFTVKDRLVRHQRIHTGEKPYQCAHCARFFSQSNDLAKHLRTHVGQNIYECSICNMRFRTRNELNRHYPMHYINDADLPTLTKIATNLADNVQQNMMPTIQENGGNGDQTITITFNHDQAGKETGTIVIETKIK